MALIYRTSGPWGTGKGTNLVPAEVDENFYDLDGKITYLQDNPPEAITPIAINIEAGLFTMGMSDGSTLGPIVMAMPVPQWRGDWTPATPYAEMDFFVAPDGGMGAVMLAHTSATTFDWAQLDSTGTLPVYQEIVGASGTTAGIGDLVDVAISSATEGDLLTYNATASLWANHTSAYVATTILPAFGGDSGSGGQQGMVPAPAAGDAAAGKVLGASGSWVVPAGGSGGSSSLAGLSDVAISAPADLSLLQYASGDGKWHNRTLATLGAGTVTSVATADGISGGPITATGTIRLAQVATLNLLANLTEASGVPTGVTLSALLDAAIGATRGSLMRRDATGWTSLAPGTAGQYLKTGGTGADPSWDSPAGSGTVTNINTGAGLVGGPITGTGTLSLATIADNALLANISGATAAPSATTLTQLLDEVLGTTQGAVIYRSATAWTALGAGTAGTVLTTHGAGANPTWAAAGGSASSITVSDTPPISPAPQPGDGWWDSIGAQLYIRYDDGTSAQWVPASNQPGPPGPPGPSIPLPVAIASGGTGAVTAPAALTSLGAAPIASPSFTGNATFSGNIRAAAFQPPTDAGTDQGQYGFASTNGPKMVCWGTTSVGAGQFSFYNASSGQAVSFSPTGDIAIAGSTATKPGGGSWVAPSDRSLKSAAAPWHTGLAEVLQLEPIIYRYNNAAWNMEDMDYVGVDAADAAAVIPEMGRIVSVPADDVVIVSPQAPPDGVPPGHQTVEVAGIEPGPLVYALVNAIKELAARLDKLEKPGVVQ
jgi:hypothetical protein